MQEELLLVFQFWISPRGSEIFVIEVCRCPKLPQILHVFGPRFFFLGGGESPQILEHRI